MNARGMHYDFKQKLNKIDSQQNRDLKVPEIDWKLNEAQEVFCKIIANPRLKNQLHQLGFEINQRTVDDIRTIVIDQKPEDGVIPVVFDESSFIVSLPNDYWYLSKVKIYAKKGSCEKVIDGRQVQHDDKHERSVFDRSSFIWQVSNYRFNKDGIRFFTDGTFQLTKVCLEYLKKPRMIHNAQDFIGGTYNTPEGVALTGSQDCELPEPVHREIVDLAVFITANDISLPDTNQKQIKLNLTN